MKDYSICWTDLTGSHCRIVKEADLEAVLNDFAKRSQPAVLGETTKRRLIGCIHNGPRGYAWFYEHGRAGESPMIRHGPP